MTALARGLGAGRALALAAGIGLALAFVAGAGANTYTNPNATQIADATGGFGGSVTPGVTTTTINVTETSTVSSITVTLSNVYEANADDLDISLISPGGTRVVLMSDAGKDAPSPQPGGPDTPIDPGTNLTFSDAGSTPPEFGTIQSGTYRPVDYGPADPRPFGCEGAGGESDPPGPFTTTLSSFNGQQANGTWTLELRDDCPSSNHGGALNSGWCLIVNTSSGACQNPTAVMVGAFRAVRVGSAVRPRWRSLARLR